MWVSLEFVQIYMISGFPWMLLGYGFHQSPYLIQIVDITGVFGLAALIVMVNIGLYKLLQGWADGRLVFRPALLALVCLIACFELWVCPPAGSAAADGPESRP